MGVLVFAEAAGGHLKKTAFEAVNYGYETAQLLGLECKAVIIGNVQNPEILGKYGAQEVVQIDAPESFDSQVYTAALKQAVDQLNTRVLVISNSAKGKAIGGRLSFALNAGLVSGAVALPDVSNGFSVRKGVFSSKAFAHVKINSDIKIVSLMGNSIPVKEVGSEVAVRSLSVDLPAPKIIVKEVKVQQGVVPLPEAELVVSAGRGMKAPENWNIIEDLANELGATTACSRPVSDIGWRPHHEHVGQTGIAIRPNLYIAVGISGAIQHLAGVNNSKVIVVINKDPEAPFFKAANYGICADLFDVVPKLTKAIQDWKANN